MAKVVYDFEKPIVEMDHEIAELHSRARATNGDLSDEITKAMEKRDRLVKDIYSKLTRWERVLLARHPDRPYTNDYIDLICDSFVELHGDRQYGDDTAIVAGLATIENRQFMLVGHQKGRGTRENLHRNFGMPNPEGYRKALRLMKLGAKFNRPVVTFVDTPGAFPGIGAEERGQAEAIARNLLEMSRLPVPILIIIIGEGASGGALGIGLGDKVFMMENTWYSVISPEGCASILFRDSSKASEAAEALKPTPDDLMKIGVIDGIISEPMGGAHRNRESAAIELKETLIRELDELSAIPVDELLKRRVEKFSVMGAWEEEE